MMPDDDILDTSICPLCGGDNGCPLAVSAESSGSCWCESLTIPRGLLDKLPIEARNRSCICRNCVERHGRASRDA